MLAKLWHYGHLTDNVTPMQVVGLHMTINRVPITYNLYKDNQNAVKSVLWID